LARLVIECDRKNIGSWFLSKTFKIMNTPMVLISYADIGQNHVGYIYQATNWIYTGIGSVGSKNFKYADGFSVHERHSKKINNRKIKPVDIVKSKGKHRYYKFLGSKKFKKEMLKKLRFSILPYPKGESKRYDTSATFAKQVQMF